MAKNISAKKIAIISAIIIIAAAASLVVLEKTGVTNLYENSGTTTHDSGTHINYDPPTDEEQQAADKQKEETIQQEENRNDSSNTSSKKNATVVITDAAQYDNVIEVRSFVSDHYQDGTCNITFIQGNHKVVKTTPAYRDASTTICTNPLFNRSEFPTSGVWQVSITYTSADAEGVSKSQSVTIR